MAERSAAAAVPSQPARGKRLLYVITEDWFFVSHFLPMAEAALALGFEVAVVTRVREHRDQIEAVGARVIPLQAERASFDPRSLASTVWGLRRIMRHERPDIVHCIALRGIVTGGTAARLAGIQRQVYAVTGAGVLGASGGLARRALGAYVRAIASAKTVFLFENRSDPAVFGLTLDDGERARLVGGTGADPVRFGEAAMPPQPPLRVAMVSRLIWSKGVDLAVEAVQRARTAGAGVELSLYGEPDQANPKAISQAQIDAWARLPGVRFYGRTNDRASVWRAHHVCCVPSRGGEGLPRTMLDGAAIGRAILTTDVPGCRDFARDGVEGRVVPPNDVDALSAALVELAGDPDLVAAMGRAARARLLDGYTEADVQRVVGQIYLDLLAR